MLITSFCRATLYLWQYIFCNENDFQNLRCCWKIMLSFNLSPVPFYRPYQSLHFFIDTVSMAGPVQSRRSVLDEDNISLASVQSAASGNLLIPSSDSFNCKHLQFKVFDFLHFFIHWCRPWNNYFALSDILSDFARTFASVILIPRRSRNFVGLEHRQVYRSI